MTHCLWYLFYIRINSTNLHYQHGSIEKYYTIEFVMYSSCPCTVLTLSVVGRKNFSAARKFHLSSLLCVHSEYKTKTNLEIRQNKD